MPIDILVVGNEMKMHMLIVDILEMTFKNSNIEQATNVQGLFNKLNEQPDYDLIIIDCQNSGKEDEELIHQLRMDYPHCIDHTLFLFDPIRGMPGDKVLADISYIVKPFSLDEFDALVKRTCLVKQ